MPELVGAKTKVCEDPQRTTEPGRPYQAQKSAVLASSLNRWLKQQTSEVNSHTSENHKLNTL
jgi:hypothetical protein